MKRIKISSAIERELEKNSSWKILLYLHENGESKVYPLAKKFNWSTGKLHQVINKLVKSKAIIVKIKNENGRACKYASLQEEAKP